MDIALWPWQRIPESWRCAECQKPATRYWGGDGVLVLSCDDHEDALGDILMDRFGLGVVSGGRVRHPWSYWLRTRLYLLKRTFWPPERRQVRRMKADEIRLQEVFKDFRANEPTVIERWKT